jgi:hypothetical protein
MCWKQINLSFCSGGNTRNNGNLIRSLYNINSNVSINYIHCTKINVITSQQPQFHRKTATYFKHTNSLDTVLATKQYSEHNFFNLTSYRCLSDFIHTHARPHTHTHMHACMHTHTHTHTHTHMQALTHIYIYIIITVWGNTKSLEPEIINGPNIFLQANK